jgi:hypothetical protein
MFAHGDEGAAEVNEFGPVQMERVHGRTAAGGDAVDK